MPAVQADISELIKTVCVSRWLVGPWVKRSGPKILLVINFLCAIVFHFTVFFKDWRRSRNEKNQQAAATFFDDDREVDKAAAAVPPFDAVSHCVSLPGCCLCLVRNWFLCLN